MALPKVSVKVGGFSHATAFGHNSINREMNKLKSDTPNLIEDHLAKLYGRINYERQLKVTPQHFKLRNMREILGRFDDPHLQYPVIHVAGTKGKGSTCTMLGQVLTTSGRKTGVYTSPHLKTIHQRMAIDGKLITDGQLVDVLSELWPVVESMDKAASAKGFRPVTFFEITTAAALLHFAKQKCEAVVLEVGLGGRLDSTNVCQPTTCVITNISVDHTRQLGSTVDKIAFEKAGIIKNKVPVVSGAIDPDAAQVIAKVAEENDAPLFLLNRDFEIESTADQVFSFAGRIDLAPVKTSPEDSPQPAFTQQIGDLKTGMIGQHQRVNASICIAAIETLNQRGWEITEASIREGLGQAMLFGRTEVVSQSPTVVIDMAHNEASINALVETLKKDLAEFDASSKKTLILAMSRDKDAEKIMGPLVQYFDQIILTKYQDNPRGKDPKELLRLGTEIQKQLRADKQPAAELVISPTPTEAWVGAWAGIQPSESICVSGSAFLVAELRKTILAAVK